MTPRQVKEFAEKKADLVARARTQREWSSQGVRNAMRKAPDNDKNRRRAQSESSEKQAQKVRQMESRIARLEEVAEPRKEWTLNFTIGSAPRSSSVVATLDGAVARVEHQIGGGIHHHVDAAEGGQRRRPAAFLPPHLRRCASGQDIQAGRAGGKHRRHRGDEPHL